ncbi:MAG: ROK family protein [Anaerolineae bacterium]|nr:ROK family protein [Anaerolineae bacterium]
MASPVIIALDVGGSSVKSGLIDPEWLRHPPDPFPITQIRASTTPVQTEAAAPVVLGALASVIRLEMANAGERPVMGVGFGFPSPFDYERGICLIDHIYKYQALYGMDVGAALREKLGLPDLRITFRNDAEAAIVAEAVFGAGRPYRRVIGLTLGTGLGSSFVIDGVRQTSGPGVPAQSGGFLFPEPYRDATADDFFSTRGLLKRLHEADASVGSVADGAARATSGDTRIAAVFAAWGAELGVFLADYALDFQPEAVVLLGGIARAFDLFAPALSAAAGVPALPSALGEAAALIGAAEGVVRRLEPGNESPQRH